MRVKSCFVIVGLNYRDYWKPVRALERALSKCTGRHTFRWVCGGRSTGCIVPESPRSRHFAIVGAKDPICAQRFGCLEHWSFWAIWTFVYFVQGRALDCLHIMKWLLVEDTPRFARHCRPGTKGREKGACEQLRHPSHHFLLVAFPLSAPVALGPPPPTFLSTTGEAPGEEMDFVFSPSVGSSSPPCPNSLTRL